MKMLNKENKSKRQASYTKNGRKAKLKAKRKMPRFWPRVECSVQGSGVTERGSVRIILYYNVPSTFTTTPSRPDPQVPAQPACIAIFQFQKQFCSANIRVVKDKLCKYIYNKTTKLNTANEEGRI